MPNNNERASTQIQMYLEQYLGMMEEALKGEQNTAYAGFVSSVQKLSRISDEFYKVNPEGHYPALRQGDNLQRLSAAYHEVLIAANGVIADQVQSPLHKVRRELAEIIQNLAKDDFTLLCGMDISANVTLPDLVEQSRTVTVDTGDAQLKGKGGQMSQRIPLEVIAPDGSRHKGFFTRQNNYDPKSDLEKALSRVEKKFPQEKAILQNILDGDMTNDLAEMYSMNYEILTRFGQDGPVRAAYDAIRKKENRPPFQNEEFKEFYQTLFNELAGPIQNFTCMEGSPNWLQLSRGANIDSRNAAMSAMANLLGMPDIIAKSSPMELKNKGETIKGTFMENAEGSNFYDLPKDSPVRSYDQKVYDQPQVLHQLADMQVLDFICGNLDRHEGNFFMQFDNSDPDHPKLSKIVGIDNDMAFGLNTQKNSSRHTGNKFVLPDQMLVISQTTAERVLSIDEDLLRIVLRPYNFSEAELKACWTRTKEMQDQINDGIEFYAGEKDKSPNFLRDQKLKIVRDEEWANYNLDSLSTVETGEKLPNGSAQLAHPNNQFDVFTRTRKLIAEHDRSESEKAEKDRAQVQPEQAKESPEQVKEPVPTIEAHLEVPDSVTDEKVQIRADLREMSLKHDYMELMLQEVEKAAGTFKSSQEYHDLITSLKAVTSHTIPDNADEKEREKAEELYDNCRLAAVRYIRKKENERDENPKSFNADSKKRVDVAFKVLNACEHFCIGGRAYTITTLDSKITPARGTDNYEKIYIPELVSYIKKFCPDALLNTQEILQEIKADHDIIAQADHLANQEEQLRLLARQAGFEKIGIYANRLQNYIFFGHENDPEFMKLMKDPGEKGYHARQKAAKELIGRALAMKETDFDKMNTSDCLLKMGRENLAALAVLRDYSSISEFCRQMNYVPGPQELNALNDRCNRLASISNCALAALQSLSNPMSHVLNKLTPDQLDIMKVHLFQLKDQEILGAVNNFYAATQKSQNIAKSAVHLMERLKGQEIDENFYENHTIQTFTGLSPEPGSLSDRLLSTTEKAVLYMEKPGEESGRIVIGNPVQENVKIIKGDRFAFMGYGLRDNLQKILASGQGRVGNSSQFEKLCLAASRALDNFTPETADALAEASRDYVAVRGRLKQNNLRKIRINLADDLNTILTSKRFKDAKLRRENPRYAKTRADQDKAAFEKEKQDRYQDDRTRKGCRLACSRFYDEIMKLPEGKLKELGMKAYEAKKRLSEVSQMSLENKSTKERTRAVCLDRISDIMSYQDAKICAAKNQGDISQAKDSAFYRKSQAINNLQNSMTISNIRQFLIFGQEKDLHRNFDRINRPIKEIKQQLKAAENTARQKKQNTIAKKNINPNASPQML